MIRSEWPVNDRILDMLRHGTLASVGALLLWIGGCPNRQETKSVVVYVPAQAPATAPTAEKSQVLVIEEPAPPPEPEETPPRPTPEPTAHRRPRRPAHTETPAETPTESNDTSQESPETPPAEVPALEPRASTAQEAALRQQVQRLQQDVRQRIARLNPARLSPSERKTLDDASTFLAQSIHAFESSDLQRALNLAQKASLLVAALE
jgi:outer membrane biosynthesis protein TonB